MGSKPTEESHSAPASVNKPARQPSPAAIGVGILVLALGAAYLLKTNPSAGRWEQAYDPTGHWWLSTMVASLPVILLLGAMAVLRLKAHVAALLGLTTALAVAIVVFHMPVRLALTTTVYGAGYGIFPICWIIVPVIFLYQLTVKTGRFEALQHSLANITDDGRLQLLLIAFGLGAFLEGSGGFGAPVAVCGAILISLGFRPLQAAGLSLIANTAPVAFGSLGIPTIALQAVTGMNMLVLSRTIAILLVPFCILLPFWLVWTYAGFRAMVEVWPAILVAGVPFSVTQYLLAAHTGPGLVDIAAAMSTIVSLIVFLRFWKPKRILNAKCEETTGQERVRHELSAGATFKAWLPWLTLSVLVFAWGIPQFTQWVDAKTSVSIPVAGLHNVVERVPPVVAKATAEAAVFNLNWLAATGTGILVAAVLAGFLMGVKPGTLAKVFAETVFSVRFTVMTIAAMMALGFVMRYCGLDATLGLAFARTGALYPFFGTLIGWLGTATTGSDTSSNVVFGSLQTMTARQIGVAPVLMASANAAGGVMGKMIAAPSIVVASTATQSYGQEGTILRYVFWHSLALAALVGVFVYLIAYVHPFTGLVW
ncbi:MAG: L-lactate permease [Terracidiphilus sp.]|nr:L-lactate permease [Terracidiphilus sp.]